MLFRSASWHYLAYAYESAGDLGRAIPLYERTLADAQRVLGDDHPNTLAFRSNLAGAYSSAGDVGRAIPLYEQTLADMRRVLGEDHPATLRTRNALLQAQAIVGVPGDDRLLVDYWLSTGTWVESFAVLYATEARLRSATATEELAMRAKRGDSAAAQHQRILDAAQHLDRPTLFAIVTNPERALESAVQYSDAGRYENALDLLALNATATGQPEGIAAALIIMLAAGENDAATARIHELQETDLVPAVLTATTQLRDRFASEPIRIAAAELQSRLEE